MILTHGANSLERGGGDYVEIGGRKYKTVKIGNQIWMAENLAWDIGDNMWYDNDQARYDALKCGRLYSSDAVELVKSNAPDGWKIPSTSDFTSLMNQYSNFDLISTNYDGNNSSGLDIVLSGSYNNGDQFHNFNFGSTIWCNEYSQSNRYQFWTTRESYGLWNEVLSEMPYLSIRLISFDYGKVTIGGRDYKTVKIGNQEWLAENLDYKFDVNGSQIPIGSGGTPSTPAAWYYNNDESAYGIDGTYKCGLLYNWYAAKYLDDNKATLLPNGWHVPSDIDVTSLASECGGSNVAGTKLKSLDNSITSNWPSSWSGTNDYGFNAIPSGWRHYQGIFQDFSSEADFWLITEYDSTHGYEFYFNTGESINIITSVGSEKRCGFFIRLVKNVT